MPAPIATMPASSAKIYLPTEIWFEIASLRELKDLWVCVRRVDQQLSACTEQFVRDMFFRHATLIMTRAGPMGPETSTFRTIQTYEHVRSIPSDIVMAVFYRTRRKSGLNGANSVCWWGQSLMMHRRSEEQIRWELELCGQRRVIVGLRPKFFLTDEHEQEGRFCVRWKTVMRLFCQALGDTQSEHQPTDMPVKAKKLWKRFDPSSLRL